jgi:predicted DNA-binding transcriptional regulator AlpA
MRFLTKRNVCEKIAVSRATLDRLKADPKFPKRVQRGGRVYWPEDEIHAWMLERMAARQKHSDTLSM